MFNVPVNNFSVMLRREQRSEVFVKIQKKIGGGGGPGSRGWGGGGGSKVWCMWVMWGIGM